MNTITRPASPSQGDVEAVGDAIGFALLELERDTLAHGLTRAEWQSLATAALTAMAERDRALREVLQRIMPISIEAGSDFDTVHFGDGLEGGHRTRAMTMNPDDWKALSAILASTGDA